MTAHGALMLVSARVDERLRREVAQGLRPRPEYLVLESDHGVDLLDWSQVAAPGHGRSAWRSAVHVGAAMSRLGRYEVVFSDGEHVGIPLAVGLRGTRRKIPHLLIAHRLSSGSKGRLMRRLGHGGMSRILVHSPRQYDFARHKLGLPESKLAFIPYYADADFWHPLELEEERLVVSAGREHRDYATLAAACDGIPARVFVASGSVHSPRAGVRGPHVWPANFDHGFAGYPALRELYARASVVVVPVMDTDFQAGVTTVLEAMAMGKAVVTTDVGAQGRVVEDGITGLCVRPGNAVDLRGAVEYLLGDERERRRLGRAAREAVLARHTVEIYAARLAEHLAELGASARVAA
jgi:glycosyltransferase involved in cell wall biosynthesis